MYIEAHTQMLWTVKKVVTVTSIKEIDKRRWVFQGSLKSSGSFIIVSSALKLFMEIGNA